MMVHNIFYCSLDLFTLLTKLFRTQFDYLDRPRTGVARRRAWGCIRVLWKMRKVKRKGCLYFHLMYRTVMISLIIVWVQSFYFEVHGVSLERNGESSSDAKSVSSTVKSDEEPQMCVPYASGIYNYLREMEKKAKRRPIPDYLDKVQKDMSANMRVLVDWLVEVAEEYKLETDTLYLAVSYLDRYLSMNVVNRRRLQLIGISSMLIAAFESIILHF